MASELKMRRTEWGLLCILSILFGTSFFFAKTAGGMVLIVLGLTTLHGDIWPRIGRSFRKYNEQIKMMPHM